MRLRLAEDCVLDLDRRQVFRGGRDVPLSPKAYELLTLLVDARPAAVAKEKLYHALWPDTFVVEANLPNLVAEIRAALGDSARAPRIIRTIHRFGYALVDATGAAGQVRAAEPPSCWLRGPSGDTLLAPGENLVGRGPGIRVRIEDGGVSRRHARIMNDDEQTTVEDLGSKNGTFVSGERVSTRVRLRSGDRVSFGPVVMTYLEGPDFPTQTVPGSEKP